MSRLLLAAVIAVVALALAACGTEEPVSVGGPDPAAGMCPVGTPDCVDADLGDDEAPDELPRDRSVDQMRADAQALIGAPEEALGPDVRVGRRGAEQMMLTMDYVIGRMTVEIDDDGTGAYTVTSVIVELPDGPETFR